MHNLNWEDLRHFAAVSRTGSVAAAGRDLGVNYSTVLRRLESLERALGVRLFERLQSGYVMTAAGEVLKRRLAPVEEALGSAQRELGGIDGALSGTIRLTTTDTLAHGLLMPILQRFQALHPGVDLQLIVSNQFLSLTQREADVAVRPSNVPPSNLVGRKAGVLATGFYASRAYLEQAQLRGVGLTDWAAHRWVVPDASLAHLAAAEWLARTVPAQQYGVRADSLLTMVDAARHDMGVAPLLTMLAEGEPSLVRLAEPDPQFHTQLWVLTHRDLRNVARIKALNQFLYDALRAHPHLL